jgi:hypothetical protein
LLGLLEAELRPEEASPGAGGGAVVRLLPDFVAPTAVAVRRGGVGGSASGKALERRRSGWPVTVWRGTQSPAIVATKAANGREKASTKAVAWIYATISACTTKMRWS